MNARTNRTNPPTASPAPTARHLAWLALATAAVVAGPAPADAVIIIGPTNPVSGRPEGGQNTGAPTGGLANSGYQYEGLWQGIFTGTPIAPNYFITAAHLGGLGGQTFTFNGQNYTTSNYYTDPNGADLVIWQITGTFPTYAPLYTTPDEGGQSMTVYGRGGPPGSSTANGVPLNGWQWGSANGTLSWGTNQVTAAGPVPGESGQYLQYQFSRALGPNTGALTGGDSGGGVFIQKNGVWMLAGVNSFVDGPYNTLPASDPNSPNTAFNASLWDARGLYYQGSSTPISGPNEVPSTSYSTRISTEMAWIASVTGLAVPEPGSVVLLLAGLGLAVPMLRRRRPARTGSGS